MQGSGCVGHQYGVYSDGDSRTVPPKYKPDMFLLHHLKEAMCEGAESHKSASGEGQTGDNG